MPTRRPLHPMAQPTAAAYRAGRMDRREFFALMAAFGVSAAGARALGGISPAAARTAQPQRGGTLRVTMLVKELRDPMLFEWSEPSIIANATNDYLVRRDSDFTFTPRSCRGGRPATTRKPVPCTSDRT
jgi:peptide/nickel transport system substrate-binding protein